MAMPGPRRPPILPFPISKAAILLRAGPDAPLTKRSEATDAGGVGAIEGRASRATAGKGAMKSLEADIARLRGDQAAKRGMEEGAA
jgi:hypothetical protein